MRIACLLLLLAPVIAVAQERSFVACPVVRDTKTVPCFLAEYQGELYFLGIQQDITAAFHPPQLKHEVLVEGRVSEGPRVCGGIPLASLSISVFKELKGYSGWVVLEAEQDPKKAPTLAYAKKGVAHLRAAL